MKSQLLILAILIFILPMISAEVQTLGTFKINDCIVLKQTCSNCSYVNITSVLYPNSTEALGQVQMTKSRTNTTILSVLLMILVLIL